MNTSPTLDQEVFEELYESVCEQANAVASLYETFLRNAARLIETLRATDSSASREKTLHTLKGSAAMMGAARIARLATDLQHTCATLDEDGLQSAVRELDTELAKMRQAVDVRLASLDLGRARD